MPDAQQDSKTIKQVLQPLLNTDRSINQRVQDIESYEQRLALIASSTPVTLVNSNAPTNLYAPTLLAYVLRTNHFIRAYMPFIYLNSTGSDSTLKFLVKYGGLTILNFDTLTPTHNAASRGGYLEFFLIATGLVTTQEAFGHVVLGPLIGTPGTDQFEAFATGTLATIDDSVDQTLSVTVQHGTNNPSISIVAKLFLVTGPYVP